MPELEELTSRLSSLENSYNNDKREAREKSFFDKYGAKFKNDRGVGLSILNELDRQGIDVSAADEAVEHILDDLRVECRELMDIIGDVKQAVEEQADKIDAIKDVVDKEVADNPDSNVEPDTGEGASEGGETPPLPEGGEPPIPPEGGEPPAEPMPPEGDEAPMPPEGGEPPAEPEGNPEEEKPETVPSDERIKKINGVVSNIRMKRIQSKKGVKISPAFVNAAMKGF
ncbi:MAG: hypothetical protein J6V73_08670 [Spirochaetaceae bacterium]|nr:hypothetical protein [Spirochaetaceae bacterium]MBO7731906.1 hypothetical protein [Methanobrevibacter sp.]